MGDSFEMDALSNDPQPSRRDAKRCETVGFRSGQGTDGVGPTAHLDA
jgi:hypothetical protein